MAPEDAHVIAFGEDREPAAEQHQSGGLPGHIPCVEGGCGRHGYFTRTDAAADSGVQRRWVLASWISASFSKERRGRTASVRELGGLRRPARNCGITGRWALVFLFSCSVQRPLGGS